RADAGAQRLEPQFAKGSHDEFGGRGPTAVLANAPSVPESARERAEDVRPEGIGRVSLWLSTNTRFPGDNWIRIDLAKGCPATDGSTGHDPEQACPDLIRADSGFRARSCSKRRC